MDTTDQKVNDVTPNIAGKSLTSQTIALVSLCFALVGPVASAVVAFFWDIGLSPASSGSGWNGALGVMAAGLILLGITFIVLVIDVVLGILAVIFGMKARSLAKKDGAKTSMAVVAVCVGILDILISIIGFLAIFVLIHSH